MAMVCAQCSQVYAGAERQCPKCGLLLLMQQHGVSQPGDSVPLVDPRNRWQQTPWGRIVVSVLLAQGLAFCLKTLFTAWFLASAGEGERAGWNTPEGLLWLNTIHAFSLILCGMLAGANQVRGMSSGGLVGLWNGLIFVTIQRAGHDVFEP